MQTKIQKWGNSQGLRLAKHLLEDAQLGVGDEVDIVIQDGLIVIHPVRKIRGRYLLEDLVAEIPRSYRSIEVDWGEPAGKEEW